MKNLLLLPFLVLTAISGKAFDYFPKNFKTYDFKDFSAAFPKQPRIEINDTKTAISFSAMQPFRSVTGPYLVFAAPFRREAPPDPVRGSVGEE